MLKNITCNYEKGKSNKIKLIALCIKAVTGVLGASMILSQQKPYLTLFILSLGAVINEILNFINTEEQKEKTPEPPNQ